MTIPFVLNASPEVLDYVQSVYERRVEDGATLYACLVLRKEILAGPWVRLACQRHLNDLDRPDVIWDVDAAQRAINFFPDMLVFTDGDKVGEPFVLELWQQFIVGSLFGWKGEDGWRRFRNAYIEIGKGNGKSPLAGGIGIMLLAADNEGAAEVYAAATKLDQAKILWNDAKRMVESSPILADALVVRSNAIVDLASNSVFKPISSEKRGLDGPRVHGGLIDEIHEHADPVVVNKLRAGTKARKQALIVEITNSGVDKTSICYQHHEFTIRLLKGVEQRSIATDAWFGFICALDEKDKWDEDESCWIKANPNLGVSIQLKYLREQVSEARGMPAKRSIVARLNFCQWVGAENPWIDEDKWNACQLSWANVDEKALRTVPCFLGLDLSSRKDLTALAAVWKFKDGLLGKVFYFTPKEGLEERAKNDRTPYDVWVEEGWIKATPGSIVDYAFVADMIKQLDAEFNVVGVAFDPWRIGLLENELSEVGCTVELIKHGQGFTGGAKSNEMDEGKIKPKDKDTETLWMPKSIEVWEEAILNGQYKVEDNPVTTMCSANAVLVSDPAGNRKFEKRKATGRMDGTVAQAMAVGFAESRSTYSKYESEGLLTL